MDVDVLARYQQKVKDFCGGIDPYDLKSEKAPLPRTVGYFDVYNYCIMKDSAYTHDSFRAYKSLQAYQYFENGWVQSIECKQIATGFIVVAKVKHSYRVNLKALRCWTAIDVNGIVLTAHCECMAGLGEVCSHVGALLFVLEAWNRKSTEIDSAGSCVGMAIGGVCILKDSMQGERFMKKTRMNGKVVLITGCNTGIGKETAMDLAKRGAHVYMACRDLKKCEEARKEIVLDSQNGDVYCRECDLASFKSIRNFVTQFQKDTDRLDVLINNAGVMRCPRSMTKDGIEMQLGVNHMGHFLLTILLLETLKKSTPSRIVVVSSIAHERGKINCNDLNSDNSYDEGSAYNQSKLANILFANELSRKLTGTGVTVNSVHPGIVDTDLMRHMSIYSSWIAKIFVRPLVWPFLKNARAGAQTIIALAVDPKLQKTSGEYFCDLMPTDVSEAAKDERMAKWLWNVSEKWTGVSF